MVSKRKSTSGANQIRKKFKVEETKEDKKVITSKCGRKKSEKKVDEDEQPRKPRSNPQLLDSLPVHRGMCVDLESLGSINFDIPWVKEMRLTKLLTGCEFTYDSLVREFYRNLSSKRKGNELCSIVRNVKIKVDSELLETLFDLHHEPEGFCIGNRAEKDIVCEGFDDRSFQQSLLEGTGKPFGVGNFKAHARFMHMVIIKNLLPRAGSKDRCTLADRLLMWHMTNNRPIDFAHQIICNILTKQRDGKKPRQKSVHLPHGNLLTEIFKHFNVPISDTDRRSRCSRTINAKYWLCLANFTQVRGWVLVKFVDPRTDVVIYDKRTVLSRARNEDGGNIGGVDDDDGVDADDDDGGVNGDGFIDADDEGADNDHEAGAISREAAVHDPVDNEVALNQGNEITLAGSEAGPADGVDNAADKVVSNTAGSEATVVVAKAAVDGIAGGVHDAMFTEAAPGAGNESSTVLGNVFDGQFRVPVETNDRLDAVNVQSNDVEQEITLVHANDKSPREPDFLTSEFEDVGKIAKAAAEEALDTEMDFVEHESKHADINRDTFVDHSRDEDEGADSNVHDVCDRSINESGDQQSIGSGASIQFNELDNDTGTKPEQAADTCGGREELPLPQTKIKKLLILDLNGVLVCTKPFHTRPYVAEFLQFCFKHFDVAIWSSKMEHNILRVLPDVLPSPTDKTKLKFVWDQTRCMKSKLTLNSSGKEFMFKDLEAVWEEYDQYNTSNTVLIDDSPYKAFMNSDCNFIFPKTYTGDAGSDNLLDPKGSFVQYMEALANADDVSEYIKRNRFGEPGLTEGCDLWNLCKQAVSPAYLHYNNNRKKKQQQQQQRKKAFIPK